MSIFGEPASTSASTQLTKQQTQLVGMGMPHARRYARRPNKALKLQGDTVVDTNAQQTQGQDMALQAASGQQQQLADAGTNASRFLLTDVLRPESNPALAGYIDAATRPIQQKLMEETMPGLRSGAAVAGQYGSTRQGIAEGLASGRASTAIGDTSARIASEGYGQGLDAMTKALGLLPSTQAAALAPAVTTSGVGDVRQQMAQRELDAQQYKRIYNAQVPLSKAQNLIGLASGTPGGSTTTTTTGGSSLLQGALGGAGIGNALLPGIGGLAGGGIGALLSLFD